MSSQGAKANQQEDLTGGAMATFMPHLLVQLVALLAASGGLILLALSQWPGIVFALLFLLFQVSLHFFIKSTNTYVQSVPVKSLQVGTQVVQSAFVVMGIVALSILFWWLFEWCLFHLENGSSGSDFYFDLHGVVLSLVPELLWMGLVGEGLRQLFPLLKKVALTKYFTTSD
ncbi:hypothetical protein DXT99_13310 [Pontibacter diazotrophicus]|uniref:Uncharacterized protein n=1 Tax=Pontibacter diazotrophicus TaxID=1400979 RepID=A0A3D8LCG3_9BACT|nr:hypothetical protein [Pontibacter diazotrophicus]RDV14642.1 hypothetical protein DXT99_13310 [Pontibacter diazotrophicus]